MTKLKTSVSLYTEQQFDFLHHHIQELLSFKNGPFFVTHPVLEHMFHAVLYNQSQQCK